jgi:hypothetical protein
LACAPTRADCDRCGPSEYCLLDLALVDPLDRLTCYAERFIQQQCLPLPPACASQAQVCDASSECSAQVHAPSLYWDQSDCSVSDAGVAVRIRCGGL